jgi:hypothetical protein
MWKSVVSRLLSTRRDFKAEGRKLKAESGKRKAVKTR